MKSLPKAIGGVILINLIGLFAVLFIPNCVQPDYADPRDSLSWCHRHGGCPDLGMD